MAERYVALGDSFTSGAGLPSTRRDASTCGQSSLNYPRLVAKEIGAKLVDVSCGGATTDNGTQPQPLGAASWPPQLDAVTKSTDLVTVSLGGNDFQWYLGVMFGCTSVAASDPTGNPCERQGTSPASDVTARAAPDRCPAWRRCSRRCTAGHRERRCCWWATRSRCRPTAPAPSCRWPPATTRSSGRSGRRWTTAMRDAAAAAGVTFVDVLGPSEGHDICAGDGRLGQRVHGPAGRRRGVPPARQRAGRAWPSWWSDALQG